MSDPSPIEQLDDELRALGYEAMLIEELDGFITGLLVCPKVIARASGFRSSGARTAIAGLPSTISITPTGFSAWSWSTTTSWRAC